MLEAVYALLRDHGPISVTLYTINDQTTRLMMRYADATGVAFSDDNGDYHFFVMPWPNIVRIDIHR